MLIFPVTAINRLLSQAYAVKEHDIYVTIFLVAILEYIVKDILHISTSYVRQLNKYSISKEDTSTASHANLHLANLLYKSMNGGAAGLSGVNNKFNNLFDECSNDNDDDDDDDDRSMISSMSNSMINSSLNVKWLLP